MAQCCVDLTELDTSASHFDLTLVHAAKILNPTTRHHAREITRGIRSLTVPREKRIVISLTYVYGIGTSTANKIVEEANVSADTRVKDLTDDELGRIREVVDSYKVEGDLRREQNLNIKRLMEISSYRGIRHRRGLPVRGQKTKNNARTRKGPVKTVANKKK